MRLWDSSAVVPLVIRQAASTRTDRWLGEDRELALWSLTAVEITSALWRLVRDRALREEDARAAETRAQELAAASYTVVDVEGVKSLARRLLRVHTLRAADALQLAAGRPHGKTLHTLDERFAVAARREGFEVPHVQPS